MEYAHDIFISYRRGYLWPPWVKKHFVPLLRHFLNDELDWDARIFWDQDLENENVTWPIALAKKLARSAVLVPLWTKSYFRSPWCVAEYAHMRHREIECGFRTVKKPSGLIAPAIIHDGEKNLPTEAQSIQSVKLKDYALTNLQPNTDDATELEKLIRGWAPAIASYVLNAPACDERWEQPLADEFVKNFYSQAQRQRRPSWGGK